MTTMTQAEFARHINRERSYITELKQAGRLVFNKSGKVLVEESQALILETEDPAKQPVAERHEEERQAKSQNGDEKNEESRGSYQKSRAIKEQYAAMQAKMEYEKGVGQLLEVSAVKTAVMDGDAIIRNRLESMPDTLSPLLAVENDEQKIRALLIDHLEWLLGDLSNSLKKMVES